MNKVIVSVFLALISALLASGSGAGKYNYRANDVNGPQNWAKNFPDSCGNGKRQSPINIAHNSTTYENLGAFTFSNLEEIPTNTTLQIGNNKYSYRVYLRNDRYAVEGGGLPGKFRVFSFHFHWGANNTRGSEHTIDGKKYPAAMHIVNYNLKYENISVAVGHEDGIAVLGVLFEVGSENPALASFLRLTGNLTLPREIYNVSQTHKVSALLPSNTQEFYRYNGSLTTPACQEVVTWTVFKNTMNISDAQLNALRTLKDNTTNGELLLDTYREVQALHGRTVYRTFDAPAPNPAPTTTEPTDTSNHFTPTALLVIVMAFIAMLY